MEASTAELRREYGLSMLLVTMGKDGCFYRLGNLTGHVPGFAVYAVDATGAGDAF